MNLYTFNKNSWHVKAFDWLWMTNVVEKYKTMCPYFWSWIATVILFPVLIAFRAVTVSAITIRDRQIESRYLDRDNRLNNLIKDIKGITNPDDAVFVLDHKWKLDLTNEERTYLFDIFMKGLEKSNKAYEEQRRIKALKREKLNNILDSKIIKYLKIAFIGLLTIVGLFGLGLFIYFVLIPNMVEVSIAVGILLTIIGGGWVLAELHYHDIHHAIGKSMIFKIISAPFRGIYWLAKVFIDMIVNTYRDACPVITWKD